MLLPEDTFEYYTCTLDCTHAGKYRNRGQPNGKSKRREVRTIGCRASISLCMKKREGKWVVEVTKQRRRHCHHLSKPLRENYASVRGNFDDDTKDQVDFLRRAGVNAKKILEIIKTQTVCDATVKDVHNLLQRLRQAEIAGTTDEMRLRDRLFAFCEEDVNNVATVFQATNVLDQVHPSYSINTVL